uniref:TPR repeat region-containing protein n=1 Tax=Mycobacteroides abscessus TaxID=36809 RepID=UPI0028BD4112|nr:hypothetical protein [Mycobacteroides abscessus]
MVYGANATALGDLAEPTRTVGSQVLDAAGTVHGAIVDLEWEGLGKDAAVGRADHELAQDKRVVQGYNALADAYRNGAAAMAPMIGDLKKTGQGLEADSFAVSEDWVVTDMFDYRAGKAAMIAMGSSEKAATDRMNQLQAQRGNEAKTDTVNLQQRADALGKADQDTAAAINTAKADIGAAAPLSAGLTGEEGKDDFGNAFPNTFMSPEQNAAALARMVAAGTLSQADLDKLARGEKVQIPAGQMAYLYQMSQSLNGKSPEEIKMLEQMLPTPETRAAFAQGLKIVSNPNVEVFGAEQLKGYAQGATDETRGSFVPVSGSKVNLPSEISKELSRTDRVTQEPSRGFVTTHLNGVGALQDINDIFKPGATITGSEATKSMLEAANQYAAVDVKHNEGIVHGLKTDAHGSLTSALADVYQTTGKDHLAVHDMVTGKDGNSFLRTVTHEQWGADSGKVGDAFRWMQEGNNPLATDTASKVAHYLADNKTELNAMPGTEKLLLSGPKSFAEINPGLAKAMAEGVSPYLADLAQAPTDSGLTRPGIEAFKNGGQLQNLFSVFDKNAESAGVINDAAYKQYQRLIENTAHPGLHGMQAEVAGRLTNAMTDGALDSVKPGTSSDAELFKAIFKKIPGAGDAFDAIDIFNKVHNGTPPSEFAQQLATAGTSSTALRASILNGMIDANPSIAHDELIKPYVKDNRIDLSGLSPERATQAATDIGNFFDIRAKGVDTDIATKVGLGSNDSWAVSR